MITTKTGKLFELILVINLADHQHHMPKCENCRVHFDYDDRSLRNNTFYVTK